VADDFVEVVNGIRGKIETVLDKWNRPQTGKSYDPPTLEGLNLYLGFHTADSLEDYVSLRKYTDKKTQQIFFRIVARAKDRIVRTLVAGAAKGIWNDRIIALVLTKFGYVNRYEGKFKGNLKVELTNFNPGDVGNK